jgi:hypothetical protein
VGTHAPLQHLPVRWRALTLVVLHDLFGRSLVSDGTIPEAACRLFRRAAPMPHLDHRQRSGNRMGKSPVDWCNRRVQRLSKSPVHRLSGNFLEERADLGPIHP